MPLNESLYSWTVCAFLFLSSQRARLELLFVSVQISENKYQLCQSTFIWVQFSKGHKQLTNDAKMSLQHIIQIFTFQFACSLYKVNTMWYLLSCQGGFLKLWTELDCSSLQTFAWIIIS